ncbi:hypothetical protein V6N13_124812 [Hibiscus sabdariffa]
MLQLHLCMCLDNLLQQDDNGDVSTETTGPARADFSKCLEKYADEIAFHFVFPIPVEAEISAGIHSAAWMTSGSLVLELHQYSSYLLQSTAACVFLYLPRNNPRELLYAFEIERTQRRLIRGIRVLMGDHIGQNPVEGQDQFALVNRQQPPAPAGGILIPPAQQNNQQQPSRTVRDYLVEDLDGMNPAVTMPEFEAEHFELKPVMFNMLNTLGQFGRLHAEKARQHLKSFLEICNSFKIYGVSNDVLKLKLFPYSLRDKEDDEAMYEAWERYRDLFCRCPMHGLLEWTQVSIFYNSSNTPTTMMLDASANGTLLDKPPREGLEILEKLAQNNYQHPTACKGTMR